MNICIVAGARPNFVKIAPLLHAIGDYQGEGCGLSVRFIYTGTEHDGNIDGRLFEDLQICRPDAFLGIDKANQHERAAAVMTAFEKELSANPADVVIVFDDLTPAMACSIVAKKMGTKVAHVVAGTRSFDMASPKEINSLVTDGLSDYMFTAGYGANNNLSKSAAQSGNAYMVGNIIIDALRENWDRLVQPGIFKQARLGESGYLLMTANRPILTNDKERFNAIVAKVCDAIFPLKLVAPLHDTARNAISPQLPGRCGNLVVTTPLRCLEFWYLEQNAKGIITDSGNVADEATFLGIPCITMNKYIEHKETVTIGTNELAGEDPDAIARLAGKIAEGRWKSAGIPERWDGRASQRIIHTLANMNV